jgi:hypothetical protein
MGEVKIIGYVIVDSENGMARLLSEGNSISQVSFPIGQCLEYCIENEIYNPKVLTLDEYYKLARVPISELDSRANEKKTD